MSDTTCSDKAPKLYGKPRYIPDLFLVGLLFIYANSFRVLSYRAGLHNDAVHGFGLVFCLALLWPVALICLVVIAVRLGICWPRRIDSLKKRLTVRLLAIIAIGMDLALLLTVFEPPGYMTFTMGVREYVRANADIPAIRAWLGTVDPSACTGEQVWMHGLDRGQEMKWPEPVMSLRPDNVSLRLDRDKHPVIRIGWAIIDADWGVEIGPEDMEISRTLPVQEVQVGGSTMYEHGEYRLRVSPGVYVWHETE